MKVERTIGRLLRSIRAGDRQLTWNDPRLRAIPDTIALTSAAFTEGMPIARRYAAAGIGENLSPPLSWSNVPAGTKELVVILQDPDAPLPRPVTHVIVTAIQPDRGSLDEGALAPGKDPAIVLGRGSFRRIGYAGPRPPVGHGPHRYIFQIYALSERLTASTPPDLHSTTATIIKSALGRGQLTGTFERQ
jgi:Raf kinase inhibitor-like YbhB/YbcL family protein